MTDNIRIEVPVQDRPENADPAVAYSFDEFSGERTPHEGAEKSEGKTKSRRRRAATTQADDASSSSQTKEESDDRSKGEGQRGARTS